MRAHCSVFGFVAALAVSATHAHGPQIQITNDSRKIVTREMFQDSPYEHLAAPKSAYVMPMLDFNGVWHSRPNNAVIAGIPQFPSGPGLSYGYDQVVGAERKFEAGSVLSVEFVDGLKLWNGVVFADAGVTQLKGFRGSNPAINSPAENFAVTADTGPFDNLSLAPVADNYDSDAHASLRWALLGDGISPSSNNPDGVYLVSMKLASTQDELNDSDPFYFVLHKNVPSDTVMAAVSSLGISPSLVQVVPEPHAAWMLTIASIAIFISVRLPR